MKKLLLSTFLMLLSTIISAQDTNNSIIKEQSKKDTIKPIQMQEVIVIGKKAQLSDKQSKSKTRLNITNQISII